MTIFSEMHVCLKSVPAMGVGGRQIFGGAVNVL